MDKTKPNCSLIGEGAYLTREVADPISSGTFWIKLKETSNNLSIGSLSKIKFKTNHIHVNFKKKSKYEILQIRKKKINYSLSYCSWKRRELVMANIQHS